MERHFTELNQRRFRPTLPAGTLNGLREEMQRDLELAMMEAEWLESKRAEARDRAGRVPNTPREFVAWFERLKESGPGQGDRLFDWIAESATREEMRWFLEQEVAGEAGFDDLVAIAQLKLPVRPKLEMARNYWDEMGRGSAERMHGPMLTQVARAFGIEEPVEPGKAVPAARELGDLMAGLAWNRRYAYHLIGALGAIELTAPGRAAKIYQGLKRLDVPAAGRNYYLIHSTLDVKHSLEWNAEVLEPLVAERPEVAPALAEGALMRLSAGARCFAAYRAKFRL